MSCLITVSVTPGAPEPVQQVLRLKDQCWHCLVDTAYIGTLAEPSDWKGHHQAINFNVNTVACTFTRKQQIVYKCAIACSWHALHYLVIRESSLHARRVLRAHRSCMCTCRCVENVMLFVIHVHDIDCNNMHGKSWWLSGHACACPLHVHTTTWLVYLPRTSIPSSDPGYQLHSYGIHSHLQFLVGQCTTSWAFFTWLTLDSTI